MKRCDIFLLFILFLINLLKRIVNRFKRAGYSLNIMRQTACLVFNPIMVEGYAAPLRLHYVPGDHGSHGSPKRSAPCDLVIFCLGTQVLLSFITFRHGLSRYPLQTVG